MNYPYCGKDMALGMIDIDNYKIIVNVPLDKKKI